MIRLASSSGRAAAASGAPRCRGVAAGTALRVVGDRTVRSSRSSSSSSSSNSRSGAALFSPAVACPRALPVRVTAALQVTRGAPRPLSFRAGFSSSSSASASASASASSSASASRVQQDSAGHASVSADSSPSAVSSFSASSSSSSSDSDYSSSSGSDFSDWEDGVGPSSSSDDDDYDDDFDEFGAAGSRLDIPPLSPQTACLFVCDVQQVFEPRISAWSSVAHVAETLTRVAGHLDMPVVCTEQYPERLGETVPAVRSAFHDAIGEDKRYYFKKMRFSMCTDEVMWAMGNHIQREHVIITGIEAHVCVLQTVLDLLDIGHEVHVVADGVSSQRPADRHVALKRMEQAGATITTNESIAFQLMRTAEHEKFKEIQKLYKMPAVPDSKLVEVPVEDQDKHI